MFSVKSSIFVIIAGLYFILYKIYPEYFLFVFFTQQSFPYSDILFSYFNAIIAFFVIVSAIGICYDILRNVLVKIFDTTETKIDNLALQIFDSFIFPIKYIIGIWLITNLLILPNNILLLIETGTGIVFLIILLLFATKFVNILFTEGLIEKSKLKVISKSLLPFVNKVIVAIIWIIGIITILSNLGYDVTALIAGAGIGGIAVALAAQKSIANIFGAITILMNKPFKVGDYVVINSVTGTVKEIGLSYLTIISRDGHQVMIPNETIISTSIENQTVRKYRRADFSIGLIYDTTLTQMEK